LWALLMDGRPLRVEPSARPWGFKKSCQWLRVRKTHKACTPVHTLLLARLACPSGPQNPWKQKF
jgi:hypothetical protein